MPKPTDLRIQGLATLDPKRVLLCQLRQIGDVVLLTPSIHMVRQRFPKAEIDVLTEKKCAPVLENNPDIRHVWQVDRKLSLFDSLRFYRAAGKGPDKLGYDLIVDFQQLPRIRWVLALANAPVKLSYPPPWYNTPFYTHWAPVSGPYAAKCKAGVLMHAFGIPWTNDPPRIHLTGDERAQAAKTLADWGLAPTDTLVTVDPTHRRASRLWPAEHYGKLLAQAAQNRPDLKFLLFFGPGEEDMTKNVLRLAQNAGLDPNRAILPPRLTSLREMAAMLAHARLHLGNCSSPRHFAVAVGTPTLILRGSTSNAWTFPGPGHQDLSLGLPCQPCDESGCPHDLKCLRDLTPETVLPQLLNALK